MHVHIEFNHGVIFKSVNFKTPSKDTTIRYPLCIVKNIFFLKLQMSFQDTVMNPHFSARHRMLREP